MKKLFSLRCLSFAAACLALSGCLNLKPAGHTARYFVLSPTPTTPPVGSPALPVGVGIVKVPDYLFKDTIAVRKSNNEVDYLLADLWAEHVNLGFQRTLAANLAAMVPASLIRLSEWRTADVAVGVYVTIEQFDVDTHGQGVLIAWWRVTSPGGDKILKSGQFRSKLTSSSPASDPQAATAALSTLVGQLSSDIAKAIRETNSAK